MEAAHDNPYLWVVYALTLLVPLYFLFSRLGGKPGEATTAVAVPAAAPVVNSVSKEGENQAPGTEGQEDAAGMDVASSQVAEAELEVSREVPEPTTSQTRKRKVGMAVFLTTLSKLQPYTITPFSVSQRQ